MGKEASFGRRWRALLVGLLAFGVAAAIHGVFRALETPDTRPVPSLAAVPWGLASVGVAAMLASTVAAARRAQGGLAKLGAGTLHVVVTLVGLCGVLAADPAFPFGPIHLESLALPGEHGRAYLYQGGLFCSQTVWRADPGQWWSTRDAEAGSYTCELRGQLHWDGARVIVVDRGGRRLAEPKHLDGLAEGLDWRPH